MQNLIIIGTSHVATESKTLIKKEFSEFKPDIVAIELDRQRLMGLQSNEKHSLSLGAIRQIGLTGYLFAVIGRLIQKKIGDIAGMNPGEEMLLGAELARSNKLPLALIDQDVHITLRNLSKNVKFSEKLRLLFSLMFSPFSGKKMKIDVRKIPSDRIIDALLTELKTQFPGLYKTLLDDRNRHMAKRLFMLMKQNPEKRVMAIVGAGHREGIEAYLKSLIDSNI